MTLLSDFKARLGKLTATKKLDADLLEIFIEDAVTEFSRHNPEHVKLKKVPTTRESNGYYDVPSDATSVVKVLVHNTDIEIEFSTEKIHKHMCLKFGWVRSSVRPPFTSRGIMTQW